jgi:hypothetical protein
MYRVLSYWKTPREITMAELNNDRLYELLPAVYRLRDAAEGEPLRALLAVIAEELDLVEADLEGLYENWFIETADEWAVAYIGDLLGTRSPHNIESAGIFSSRAYVANTLRYRRRKGTAAVLEQLARDVSNWPARVVEFFQLLGTTQHLNHVRLHNVRTPDLRDSSQLELVRTPFTNAPRTAEVRRIANGRGKFNIPNVGLFLWRLQAYFVMRSAARVTPNAPAGRFWFHPAGIDAPLFNRPQTESDIAHIAREINVPGPLRRRALYDDLEGYREALMTPGGTPQTEYFGAQPVLAVYLNGSADPLLPEEIIICDLSNWEAAGWTAPPSQNLVRSDGTLFTTQVAVDPHLGRLAVLSGVAGVTDVDVSYTYGFPGDIGGGPYQRRESVTAALSREVTWQIGVSQSETAVPGEIVNSLTAAINEWNAQPAGTVGVIAVMDSQTYAENLTGAAAVQMPAGSRLLIVAADWPAEPVPGLVGATQRVVGRVNPNRRRPHILGHISIRGTALESDESQGALTLDGLLVEGNVRVLIGNLAQLDLNHCTVVPGAGRLIVNGSADPSTENDRLQVTLWRSIAGGVELANSVPYFTSVESIIHGQPDPGAPTTPPPLLALTAPGAHVHLDGNTLLGQASARSIYASETIFTEAVTIERRQIGCVRFSYVPAGSRTPRRYRCQPDLALRGVTATSAQARIRSRLRPFFTADEYGQPAYMQLARSTAQEIHTGAEDGAEMGVYSYLKQPQREANLREALKEYLRFGLEAGLFFVT